MSRFQEFYQWVYQGFVSLFITHIWVATYQEPRHSLLTHISAGFSKEIVLEKVRARLYTYKLQYPTAEEEEFIHSLEVCEFADYDDFEAPFSVHIYRIPIFNQ